MKIYHNLVVLNLFILSLYIKPATTWSLDLNQSKIVVSHA